jgi:hypothetical protein
MKSLSFAFHRGIAEHLSKLRKLLNETAHVDRMPSSSEEWEVLNNLIAWVEQTRGICRTSFDAAAAARGEAA